MSAFFILEHCPEVRPGSRRNHPWNQIEDGELTDTALTHLVCAPVIFTAREDNSPPLYERPIAYRGAQKREVLNQFVYAGLAIPKWSKSTQYVQGRLSASRFGAIIDWISDGTMDSLQGVWDRVSKIPISFILFIVFLVVSGLVVMYVAEKIKAYKVEDYASGRLS